MNLYIFCGKGGVGKTTLATFLADYLKQEASSVILGLDQQQNHRDLIQMLDLKVDYEVITSGMTDFVEFFIDNTLFKNFKDYASLVAPDFIAMASLAELLWKIKDKYENVVIDFPPNHAGLNMVTMPPLLNNLGFKMVTMKNRIKKLVTGKDYLLEKADYISQVLDYLAKGFREAKWFVVGIATDLGLLECERMIVKLKSLNLTPCKIIVNMIQPIPDFDCNICFARYTDANRVLEKYTELAKNQNLGVVQIPYTTDIEEIYDSFEELLEG